LGWIVTLTDTDCIINVADSSSNSKCPDIPDSASTDLALHIRNGTTTIACDDELKHEHACMPPLSASSQAQVPPFASPPPDKPEELPPMLPMDAAPSAPSSQVAQGTQHSVFCPMCTLSDLLNNAITHFIGGAHHFLLLVDDFSDDREHRRQVDPGGSKFKAPGRCKVRTCAGLGIGHHQPRDDLRTNTTCWVTSKTTTHASPRQSNPASPNTRPVPLTKANAPLQASFLT